MKVRPSFHPIRYFIIHTSYFIIFFSLVSCSEQKKERQSRQAMEAELQELKANSAAEALRIKELEMSLQEQRNAESIKAVLEEAQNKSQAEYEAYQKAQAQEGQIKLSEPAAQDEAPAPPSDGHDGFSFTAVRTIPAAPTPAAATASPGPQTPTAAPSIPLSPLEQKIADLRSQLRDELNDIFDKIREHRRLRYGDVDSNGNRTYIPLSSYDPKTGQNKKGGGKAPKLDVDLENGVNQQFPEKSSCFSSQSLSATLSHARFLRDEINDLKSQTGR